MLKLDMPMSYFPPSTPVMMESNADGMSFTLRSSFFATAFNRSTSKPWIVFPSPATNSLGG